MPIYGGPFGGGPPFFALEGSRIMSRETLEWLNTNTLIGFTDKRRKAWHSRAGYNNHFSGPVPIDEVERRLFDWEALEIPLAIPADHASHALLTMSAIREGDPAPKYALVPGRKAIVRSNTWQVLGAFKEGYLPHQPKQWLLENVATILDDELAIGSAGLLRGGAQAWVSVEVPDSITTPEGVEFRPNLLACTSFDGSLATTYKRIVTNVVCDNTMNAGLSEDGQQFKVKHSSRSLRRIKDVRQALEIVHTVSADFAKAVGELCAQDFTDREFERLVREQLAPVETGDSVRKVNNARDKRRDLIRLWRHDERVAPWRGTKFGAYQAVNTYQQQEGKVRGGNRAERNMGYTLTGKWESADDTTLSLLAAV
jgi:phage/plasmid-like protein (TIGR03299 family)